MQDQIWIVQPACTAPEKRSHAQTLLFRMNFTFRIVQSHGQNCQPKYGSPLSMANDNREGASNFETIKVASEKGLSGFIGEVPKFAVLPAAGLSHCTGESPIQLSTAPQISNSSRKHRWPNPEHPQTVQQPVRKRLAHSNECQSMAPPSTFVILPAYRRRLEDGSFLVTVSEDYEFSSEQNHIKKIWGFCGEI
jgi:hypothetical protein